ncbi:MAG TPA: ATP-binding protein [Chitinophagaceae bacterium]|nr:ATP-binding protein [Chitinophagaceae bacterium]
MRYSGFAVLLFLYVGSVIIPGSALSQDRSSNDCIDISRINLVQYISGHFSSACIEKYDSLEKKYSSLKFTPGIFFKNPIPNEYVTKKLILKFRICNSSDSSASAWFFPGYFFPEIQLFNEDDGVLKKLPSIQSSNKSEHSYSKIIIPAHDSMTVLAELLPLKTYTNSLRPRLIQPQYLNSFTAVQHREDRSENIVTYIFCGLLLMMIFFSLANYLQGSNPEFLYYSGYAFFLGAMLFLKALLDLRTNSFSFFMEGYLDFVMQGAGIMFYMAFMKKFLETKTKYRFLYYLYNGGIVMLILSLLLYSYAFYFTDNFSLQNGTENLTKLLLLLMVVVFLIYSFRRRQDRLLWYLFWGNLCLFIFSLMSQFSILFSSLLADVSGVLGSGIFYYEIGIFLELIFFLQGLSYKNRRQLIEETKEKERLIAANKVMEYEQELAVLKAQQEERERISADMHDELGSGMTVIRLMSEIAKNKMKDHAPAEIEKISESANEVLNKMNAIIWSMNSSNDSLDNLIYYIRTYALEYFENTPIKCEVKMPNEIPQYEVSGNKRRSTFLSVKEALNNVLKHSHATRVTVVITIDQHVQIKIQDNGTGIDPNHIRQFGNGLKNMAKRMETIGGSFKIENKDGTLVTLELPL